jgi:hypothetical protein
MTTLTIKDLPTSEELGLAAMTAVHGGNTLGQPISGHDLSVFEMDHKSSGGGGKGKGTKTTSSAGTYLTYRMDTLLITGY